MSMENTPKMKNNLYGVQFYMVFITPLEHSLIRQ